MLGGNGGSTKNNKRRKKSIDTTPVGHACTLYTTLRETKRAAGWKVFVQTVLSVGQESRETRCSLVTVS